MRRLTCKFIFIFLCIGLSGVRPVPAIDSDSFNPYATGGAAAESAAGGGGYGPGNSGLPLMTIVGAALLVPGILASVFWKLRERKRAGSA